MQSMIQLAMMVQWSASALAFWMAQHSVEAANRELSEQEGTNQPAVVDSVAEEATPPTTEEDAAEETTLTKVDNTEQAAAERATEDPAAAEKAEEDF